MFQRCIFATIAFVALAGAAPVDPAARFGARESIEQISLSPDGTHIAYIAPGAGEGSTLFTVDIAGGEPKVAIVADGDPQRLSSCGWVADDRLVCTIFAVLDNAGTLMPVSRMVAVDADGKNLKLISIRDSFYARDAVLYGGGVLDWLPGEDGAILMGRMYTPELKPATRLAKTADGYGVDRIDTRTLATHVVERPNKSIDEYISDGHGAIRIMGIGHTTGASGLDSSQVSYSYRRKGDDGWQRLSEFDALTDEGFNPYAVDSDLDVAYGLKKKDGRKALYSVALDGSLREQLIYADPRVDVDGLLRLGRSGRVIGATFVTEKREALYFDPELAKLAASLSKALPGLPLIRFSGASLDESKLLIWAGGDTDPGRYYVFDKATKQLNEILLARPQLEGVTLAAVKPVTYKAADGTLVPAYLTLPPGSNGKGIPAIVMPHGGPEARDEWGFDWLAQFFANRGYAVLQPNFRGSTGYGDAWFQQNGFQSWRTAVGDVNDAGRWLVAKGIADPAKLAIFGWSYGGYAALQANVLDPDLFKAAVAVAPVTDFAMTLEEWRGWTNFAIERERIGTGPHIREGSPAQNAAAIKAPVLMFHGDMDRNVGIRQSRAMARELDQAGKKNELVVYPGLDHYLEDSVARADMLRRSDAFLRASMGM